MTDKEKAFSFCYELLKKKEWIESFIEYAQGRYDREMRNKERS